jgi:hypothetical protein
MLGLHSPDQRPQPLSGSLMSHRYTAGTVLRAASGIALLALGHWFTRAPHPPWSEYWYGLCWTGFILCADLALERRIGRSLLSHQTRDLVAMSAVSAAVWWGFEAANVASFQNWRYTPSPEVPRWVQRVRSTWFFATLLPATWVALALTLTLPGVQRLKRARGLPIGRQILRGVTGLGLGCGLASLALRPLSWPLTLCALVGVLDPINDRRGRPSLVGALRTGDFRIPFALVASSLATGLLGEYWNAHATPRWTYDVPWIGFWYVFEMPLLGFAGYPMLAAALWVIYQSVKPRIGPARTHRNDALGITGL